MLKLSRLSILIALLLSPLTGFTQPLLESNSISSVQDPYDWLEDSENPNTQDWLKQQKELFNEYIQSIPQRSEIKTRLNALVAYDSYTIPKVCGENYLFTKLNPLKDQYVLYIQKGMLDEPQVLLDPMTLSQNTCVAITDYMPSPDGTLVAFGLSENGSDWNTWKVLDIETKKIREDRVEKIKFAPIVWSPDSLGFYYSRFEEGNSVSSSIYYHTLDAPQARDQLIYQDLNGESAANFASMSTDSHYLIIGSDKGSSAPNSISYIDLHSTNNSAICLIPYDQFHYQFIGNKDTEFYFLTNKNASNQKLVAIDISQTSILCERDIIPVGESLLQQVVPFGDYFLASYLENVSSRLTLYDAQGKHVQNIEVPAMGTILLGGTTSGLTGEGIFLSFSTFTQPKTIYHYSLNSGLKPFKKLVDFIDPTQYDIQQIFYKSKDGTQIPMFIVYKKGLKLDGNNRVLLYGYGGFGVNNQPTYNPMNMLWLEQNGIYALANIRGGSEYGADWHRAGMKKNKQNCFDDFIAAAEWLIDNRYTNPAKLAIFGVSNGGLLTAVCANQRPELFGAVVVAVGVLDMLRFHLFTVGHFWINEYGNPDDPIERSYLSRYSPYHNIRKGIKYPPILVTTADHDDRVVPLHSYKYVAALQEAQGVDNKTLLRLDTNAGHGSGKPASKWIDEAGDVLAFIYQETEH